MTPLLKTLSEVQVRGYVIDYEVAPYVFSTNSCRWGGSTLSTSEHARKSKGEAGCAVYEPSAVEIRQRDLIMVIRFTTYRERVCVGRGVGQF